MSEPSSLYAKITISKSARQNFLASKIAAPSKYKDWLSWLANREYYGAPLAQEKINNIEYKSASVQEYLEMWFAFPRTHSFDNFNEENNIWVISMFEFAENYFDYINFLHVLRNVQEFIDLDGDDFILIHSYLWGNTGSDTAVQLSQGNSIILETIPPHYIEEAASHLEKRMNELSKMYQE